MLGAHPGMLRRLNGSAVLEALRKRGPMSRADLARHLGLSKSTVSEIVAQLLSGGLVRELGPGRARRVGRNGILIDVSPDAGFVAGADLGGTLVRVGLADLAGNVRVRLTQNTVKTGLDPLLDQLREMIGTAVEMAGVTREQLQCVAIGVPGAVDPKDGSASLSENLPFIEGVQLGRLLEGRLKCELLVENDVNLGAVGEKWQGCAKGVDNFAYLALGTGVGMGVVLGGSLFRGAQGRAGEVGYMPVPAGNGRTTLEGAVGGAAVARRFLESQVAHGATGPGSDHGIDARRIFEFAAQGDATARGIVSEAVEAVAWAIASVTVVLDLSLVVLGGGVGLNSGILNPVRERVAELVPFAPEIRISALGGDATLLGAIAIATRHGRAKLEAGVTART